MEQIAEFHIVGIGGYLCNFTYICGIASIAICFSPRDTASLYIVANIGEDANWTIKKGNLPASININYVDKKIGIYHQNESETFKISIDISLDEEKEVGSAIICINEILLPKIEDDKDIFLMFYSYMKCIAPLISINDK